MFRSFKLKDRDKVFKCTLMRNRREELAEIPSDYVAQIVYKLNENDELSMEIPNKINHNGKMIRNTLFDKVKNKRFLIVNNEEKYVINKISTNCNKGIKTKSVSATSFECDLDKKDLTLTTGISRQLYRPPDEKVLVGEGVLNILEEETGWKIGYVDKDAMFDTGLYDEVKEVELFKDLNVREIKRDTVLFEKDVDINIGEEELRFSISYSKIKCTNDKDEIIKDNEKQKHDFDKFAQGISKIKATYGVNDKFEEVIKYEFTLKDGFVIKKEEKFTYLENMNANFGFIYLSYCTGRKIEQSVVKMRWFEQGIRQWLTFLRDDVSNAYDCTFQFDTLNKIVNVIANKNLGEEDKGLYLSFDNYIKTIDKDEDSSEVITRLVVEGKEGLSIGSVNPLGTNYIEDFSYLIKQGNMSDELQLALERYDVLTKKVHEEWYGLRDQKDTKNQRNVYLQSKLLELTEKKRVQEHLRISYMKQEPKTEEIKKRLEEIKVEIDKIEAEIAIVMQEMGTIKDEIKVLDEKISKLNSSIIRENSEDENGKIFTSEDLEELDECIYSSKHQDDFYTTANGLYENAKIILKEKNKMPISFKTDLAGITKHPRGWKNVLQLGQKGIIDDEDIINSTEDGMVRVVGFTYIPPRKNMNDDVTNIEFTNKKKESDSALKRISDIGKKSDYNKTMTDFWKKNWSDSSKTNDFVKEMRETGLDTASSIIRSKVGVNEISMSESGIWCIDRTDGTTDNQVYIGCGMIGITDDGWRSAKTCIDSNGIIAQRLIGQIVFGEKLVASNEKGTFVIDGNGMTIYDELSRTRVQLGVFEIDGVTKAGLTLYDKTGRKTVLNEDGIVSTNQFVFADSLDSSNPIEFPYYVNEGVYSFEKVLLSLDFQNFRGYTKGASAGGGIKTSTSGGSTSSTSSSGGGSSNTSSAGGDHRHMMFSLRGGTSNPTTEKIPEEGYTFAYSSSTSAPNSATYVNIPLGYVRGTGLYLNPTNIYTYGSSGNHSHSVTIKPHNHSFTVNAHSHNVDTSHTHELIHGIYLDTMPSKVSVIINGVTAYSNLNGDCELDITKFLQLNKKNEIKITSTTRGRIVLNLFSKGFVGF